MKKRTMWAVAAAAMVLIVAAGLFLTGRQLGWFSSGDAAAVSSVSGTAEVERDGLVSPLEAGMALRDGDTLRLREDSALTLSVGEGGMTLREETELSVERAETPGFRAALAAGEVFADVPAGGAAYVLWEEKETAAEDAVVSLRVEEDGLTLFVYRGGARFDGENVEAGQMLRSRDVEATVSDFAPEDLSDFLIETALSYGEGTSLCFTAEELQKALSDREAARLQEIEENLKAEEEEKPAEPEEPEEEPKEEPEEEPETPAEPEAPEEPETPAEPEAPPAKTCTISIRCDTILNNLGSLTPGKEAYVPSSGAILGGLTVEFTDGETAFDVLQRACSAAGISLEYAWTPAYNSYYVEGIHNLYEFDCGPESGWVYLVNGAAPSYGCSGYQVSDGDQISFLYSCVGYGADVGAAAF